MFPTLFNIFFIKIHLFSIKIQFFQIYAIPLAIIDNKK